jgi:hypothetical protein
MHTNRILKFLAEECVAGPDEQIKEKALYKHYKKWCVGNLYPPGNKADFKTVLQNSGFSQVMIKGEAHISGISVWAPISKSKRVGWVIDKFIYEKKIIREFLEQNPTEYKRLEKDFVRYFWGYRKGIYPVEALCNQRQVLENCWEAIIACINDDKKKHSENQQKITIQEGIDRVMFFDPAKNTDVNYYHLKFSGLGKFQEIPLGNLIHFDNGIIEYSSNIDTVHQFFLLLKDLPVNLIKGCETSQCPRYFIAVTDRERKYCCRNCAQKSCMRNLRDKDPLRYA